MTHNPQLDMVATNFKRHQLTLPADRLRDADEDYVKLIAESIAEIGIQSPPIVKRVGGVIPLSALPTVAQTAFNNRLTPIKPPAKKRPLPTTKAEALPTPTPPDPTIFTDTHLTPTQRRVGTARCVIVEYIESLVITETATNITQACRQFINAYTYNALPDGVAEGLADANNKSSGNTAISLRTLQRWCKIKQTDGKTALAPKQRVKHGTPPWAKIFMQYYARPQKPTIADAVNMATAECIHQGISPPTLATAKAFVKSLSTIDKVRGRVSSRDMRAYKPFVRRDTSTLRPADMYTADGHTFKAEILHPRSNKAFRPEITAIFDVATRLCVGWSSDYAENTYGTLSAMHMAFTTWGIPAMWYIDNGGGFNSDIMTNTVTGVLARLGVTKQNSIAYNSQARGLVERAHQTLWVKLARHFDSYMGGDMDRHARQINYKNTRKQFAITGTSALMVPFADFKHMCQHMVDSYNNTPHSALDKITDPHTGNRRHMTPLELWHALADTQDIRLMPSEAIDAFRPYDIRTTRRGEVHINGHTYFHPALGHFNGDRVMVGYDIANADRVWVRELVKTADGDEQGRLICVADIDGNKVDYIPKSKIDQAIETRAKGQLRRLQTQTDTKYQEIYGAGALIDHPSQDIDDNILDILPQPKQTNTPYVPMDDIEQAFEDLTAKKV